MLGNGEKEEEGVKVKMRGWKLRKIIVQGFNRVSEAKLSTLEGEAWSRVIPSRLEC